jgi:flagellar biosynthesis GTPase FlhF
MNTELQEWYDKVVIVEQEKYDQVLSGIINSYSANQIQNLISTRIDELIKPGKREFNYI